MRSTRSTAALTSIAEPQRDVVAAVLRSVVDLGDITALDPVAGGASGALVYKLRVGDETYLLRIEAARDPLRDPHRTYPCMRVAADAGIAPPLLAADADAGVAVMAFIDQRPLSEHPGGSVGVSREIGELIARLQRTPPAPSLVDFPTLLDHMMAMLESSDLFAADLLVPIRSSFVEITTAYPWAQSPSVTSHNDINPFNVLYDGRRLWLIDWELAFRNDPLADVAGASNNLAESEREIDVLVRAWAGAEPAPATLGRLTLMRTLNRLYYACLMLSMCIGQVPSMTSLDAPSPDELRADVVAGRLQPGSAQVLHVLGRMQLAGFAAAATSPDTARAAESAAAG